MFFDSRPKVTVAFAQTGESYPCATDESLLNGMLRLGRKGIPVGCVNGGLHPRVRSLWAFDACR